MLNHRTSVDAYPEIMKPEVVKAFEKYSVLNERELKARHEVAVEQYNKSINVEAQLMVLMANRFILPPAYRFQGQLAASVAAVKAAGAVSKESKRTLDRLCKVIDECKQRVDHLQELLEHEGDGSAEKHAKYFRDKVVPAMAALRESGDLIESMVPDDEWSLPTYREMLFIK